MDLQIVPYRPEHAAAFRDINYAWIEEHFDIEDADRKALESPKEYILDRGGAILIALHGEEVVGTCALLPTATPGTLELAKMGVRKSARGLGAGMALGKAALEAAWTLGASRVYLETNSALTPALTLYRKLGFRQITVEESPYCRCDVAMEIYSKS